MLTLRRRSFKREKIEKECIKRLTDTAVLEYSQSLWASSNVFVSKEYSGASVTTDFSDLNNVTETDVSLMKDVNLTVDWLAVTTLSRIWR